mgnify:FL=1
MRLEHESLEKMKENILYIIGKHLDLNKYQVFFFGSRVAGKGDDRSDIDIGIEGGGPVSDDLLMVIKEEIDALPILYKIDLVDFQRTSMKFKQFAKSAIEILN